MAPRTSLDVGREAAAAGKRAAAEGLAQIGRAHEETRSPPQSVPPKPSRMIEGLELTAVALAINAIEFIERDRRVAGGMALAKAAELCGVFRGEAAPPPEAAPEAVPAGATALDRATAAIKAAPEKSNRSIAREIGVSLDTVNRARNRSPDRSPRIGRDGKTYGRQPEAAEVTLDGRRVSGAYAAFLMRADTAVDLASYDGPVNDEILASAEYAANAWNALVKRLQKRRT
jgi:hypothetical protein